MSENIILSIIVPVYNVENYVRTCIDSILNQEIKNIEIILVDDGSTDKSGEICDNYSKLHFNINVVHKNNEGLGFARNSGLDIARGKYVGFVDSDDYVSVNMYDKLLNIAQTYDADAVYGKSLRFWNYIDENDCHFTQGKIEIWEDENIKEYLLKRVGMPPNSKQDMLFEPIVCSGVFRREVIERMNIRFISERQIISEDMIFDLSFIPHCKKIIHIDDYLYFYRYNLKSLTMSYRKDRFKKNVELYVLMKRMLLSIYQEEEVFNSISRYFLSFTRVCLINEVSHIKENGYSLCRKNIKNICENNVLVEILNKYEYNELPCKYALCCELEKRKLINLLIFITYFSQVFKGKL